jgi:tetratricopeptide (TPR) repeat protein
MGIKLQVHEASWDMSRAFRQFQWADKDLGNAKEDAAVNRLQKGLKLVSKAGDHLVKAEEDAYNKAGDKVASGNTELQKSIDYYAAGKNDSAERHYDDAIKYYDDALDIID